MPTADPYEEGVLQRQRLCAGDRGGAARVFCETGLDGAAVGEVIHGTTVASNAILEPRGARTGLITTKGFRDVLELRRLRMPRLYDLSWEKPPALVERYLRVEDQ